MSPHLVAPIQTEYAAACRIDETVSSHTRQQHHAKVGDSKKTRTNEPDSRPITPAQQRLLRRNAQRTQQAMDNLLAASPALRHRMRDNYRPPATDPAFSAITEPKPVPAQRGKTRRVYNRANRERQNGSRQRLPDAFRKGRANVGYGTNPGNLTALPAGQPVPPRTLRRQ